MMTDVFVLKMNKNLPSSERLLCLSRNAYFFVCVYIYIYIIRAMSKISARILCLTIKYSERIAHILEKAEGSMVSALPNIFYFHD